MQKGIRRKALNFVGSALQSKLKFKGNVHYKTVAGLTPDSINLPSLYVFRGLDPMVDLTNEERESRMLIHVVAFFRDDSDAMEFEKCDIQDSVEETIYDDLTLGGNVTQATVKHADPTGFSLDPLGFTGPVLPPLGAFRMDIECLFEYQAF